MSPSTRIYKLLKHQVLLPYEWGFYHPSFTERSFTFKVRGAAFIGIVKIMAFEHKDTYTISFINERGELIRRATNIMEEELVDVLRANIDGCNAWQKIKDMYLDKSSYGCNQKMQIIEVIKKSK